MNAIYPIREEVPPVHEQHVEIMNNRTSLKNEAPTLPRHPPNHQSKRKTKSQKPKFMKPAIPVPLKRYQPTIPKDCRLEPTPDANFYSIRGEYIPEFYHSQLWDKPKSVKLKVPGRNPEESTIPDDDYTSPRSEEVEKPAIDTKSIAIQSKLGDESIKQLKHDKRKWLDIFKVKISIIYVLFGHACRRYAGNIQYPFALM